MVDTPSPQPDIPVLDPESDIPPIDPVDLPNEEAPEGEPPMIPEDVPYHTAARNAVVTN